MKQRKPSHQKRVVAIKHFVTQNKAFVIIAALLCVYLIGGILKPKDAPKQEHTQTEIVQQQEPEHWRFYWLDVWVLAVGGGFCTVMMIREKKKAKEEIK